MHMHTTRSCLLIGSLLAALAGCGDSDAQTCADKDKAYFDFLAANSSCTTDADCAVIGDCGPHADFAPVRSDAADEARKLQLATCGGAYDGPGYEAVCVKNQCALEEITKPGGFGCPGIPGDVDAGERDASEFDASEDDAGGDMESDGGEDDADL
jgi:hypothetical protein